MIPELTAAHTRVPEPGLSPNQQPLIKPLQRLSPRPRKERVYSSGSCMTAEVEGHF